MGNVNRKKSFMTLSTGDQLGEGEAKNDEVSAA
jgi:hypothetical protein